LYLIRSWLEGLIGLRFDWGAAVTVSAITRLILAKFESHSGSLSEFFVLDVTIIQIHCTVKKAFLAWEKTTGYLNYFRHSS